MRHFGPRSGWFCCTGFASAATHGNRNGEDDGGKNHPVAFPIADVVADGALDITGLPPLVDIEAGPLGEGRL